MTRTEKQARLYRLEERLLSAGDHRDWGECGQLEVEIKALKADLANSLEEPLTIEDIQDRLKGGMTGQEMLDYLQFLINAVVTANEIIKYLTAELNNARKP